MDIPRVVSPGEWLAARKDLLAREREATDAKDQEPSRSRRWRPRGRSGGPACLPFSTR